MEQYRPVIGLEIHAELKTKSKMFCGCRNDPDEKTPNKNICPICLAHPGTLPRANREAVRAVLRVGLAVNGRPAAFSEFERKSYFYPDLPKGYQISQYRYPLVEGGSLNHVRLTRIHLEEDTARCTHDTDPGFSLIDFNRAGVPLMEMVTEPEISSAREATVFAREWQLLLRYLGVSEANMEKGEMRVEANVSVAPRIGLDETASSRADGAEAARTAALGTKVEVKNLNSFRAVERAIDYEIKRQSEVLARGERVIHETRGWDDVKGETFSQRQKEFSEDYRYFPEPDLPSFRVGEVFDLEALRANLPELPWQKRGRLSGLGFLQEQDVEQLVSDVALGRFFDEAAAELKESDLVKTAANLLLNFMAGERLKNPAWPLPRVNFFVDVVHAYRKGELSMPQVKSAILSGRRVAVMGVDEIGIIAGRVIATHPKVASDFKAGKEAALQALVGLAMKESQGGADPVALHKILRQLLQG